MPRGGNRTGAGRPKGQGKYGEPTKAVRVPVSMVDKVIDFARAGGSEFPLYSSKVQAGFPSPADEHVECKLDLNEHLVQHPTATFFVRATGNSMLKAGIHPDDILVVDRSINAVHGKIVIAAIDGELTVKRLSVTREKTELLPENDDFKAIPICEENDVHIWGVVTNVIHNLE
jgi:DNA polymerase V